MGDKETECKCSEIVMMATTCKLAGGSDGWEGDWRGGGRMNRWLESKVLEGVSWRDRWYHSREGMFSLRLWGVWFR